MAQAEHLPIYKAAYDLCLYTQVVRNFSRYHKYAIGADLRDGTRQALKVLLRLAQDVNAFPNLNSFEHAVTLVTAIEKQNGRFDPDHPLSRTSDSCRSYPCPHLARNSSGQTSRVSGQRDVKA